MASVCPEPNGRKLIQINELPGRPKVRLGKVSDKVAQSVCVKIEAMLAAKASGQPLDHETAAWLGKVDRKLHGRLVALDLAAPRTEAQSATLSRFLDRYISSRSKIKPNTLRNYRATQRILQEHFGEDRFLAAIHKGHASDYREWLASRYAQATVSREIKRARQFFEYAKDCRLIAENPFAKIKAGPQTNSDRQQEIARDAVAAVLQALPDNEHRLILVLARCAGLRVPSELRKLTWDCIDWTRNRFTVHSQKLENHPTKKTKVLPIFPAIRPYLENAREEAPAGSVYVVSPRFHEDGVFRSALRRAIKRAGIPTWVKPLVNCRASGQTELMQTHPAHVVCAWIGNTEKVAKDHYLMVTEADYARASVVPLVRDPIAEAVQKAVQSATAANRQQPSPEKEPAVSPAIARDTAVQVPPRGVEPRFSD